MNKYFSIWNVLFLILSLFAIISGNTKILFLLLLYIIGVFYINAFLDLDYRAWNLTKEDSSGGWIIFASIFAIILFGGIGIIIIGTLFFLGVLIKLLATK